MLASTKEKSLAEDRNGRFFAVFAFVPFGVWIHEDVWAHEFISSAVHVSKIISSSLSCSAPKFNSIGAGVNKTVQLRSMRQGKNQYPTILWASLSPASLCSVPPWPSSSTKGCFHLVIGTLMMQNQETGRGKVTIWTGRKPEGEFALHQKVGARLTGMYEERWCMCETRKDF